MNPNVQQWVEALGLIAHPEGGYFRETYRSGAQPMRSQGATDADGVIVEAFSERLPRNLLTSIYWLPTRESPVGWLCCNRSDHVHYFHGGSALTYYVVSPDGQLSESRLGLNVAAGEVPQLVVPGGHYKAVWLEEGDFALVGEAVAPGFDFDDFQFVNETELIQRCPEAAWQLRRFVKQDRLRDFSRYYSHK